MAWRLGNVNAHFPKNDGGLNNMNQLKKTIDTPLGEITVFINAKAMVFVGQDITINRVDYVGRAHDMNLRDDGSWAFGSYTNLSLVRKDGGDAYSDSAMEKWGEALIKAATELATPENLKEAEWNEAQNALHRNIAKQDELGKEIGELKTAANKLDHKQHALELELRQIRRRAS